MPWKTTGGSVSSNGGAGSVVTKEETNDETGETRTTETTKDARGRVTHTRRTVRDRNEGETDFEETDAGPPPTRRTRKTTREPGKVTTEEEEFQNGVRRRRRRTSFFSESEKYFVDEMEYDANGNPVSKTHLGPGYHYHHDLRRTPDLRLFRGLAGPVMLPALATAGTAFGGSVSPVGRERLAWVRVRNSKGLCLPLIPGPAGGFLVPGGFTTPGKATVELIDTQEKVLFSTKVGIQPAGTADPKLRSLEQSERNAAVTVASGIGLSGPHLDETDAADEGRWDMPIAVVAMASRTVVCAPIAFSDLELTFATPGAAGSARIYRGAGGWSDAVDCPGATVNDC